MPSQHPQRLGGRREALGEHGLPHFFAGQLAALGKAVPEQRGDFGEAQLAFACAFDQREQRSQLFLGAHQCVECGAQEIGPARDDKHGFAANRVARLLVGATACGFLSAVHDGTPAGFTGPELSSWSA